MFDLEEIHRMAGSADASERERAARALGQAFSKLPEQSRAEAWGDLHRLACDPDDSVRSSAAEALGQVFSKLPEQSRPEAWGDLHRLAGDPKDRVRRSAVFAIAEIFSDLTDEAKLEAWAVLHTLTCDPDFSVRLIAAQALGMIFSNLNDDAKRDAWAVLYTLADDLHDQVRGSAAEVIGWIFSDLIDDAKRDAWAVLHRLAGDQGSLVRERAADALGRAFSHLTDEAKQEAWEDLLRLASDQYDWVREMAVVALAWIFSDLPSIAMLEAWAVLYKLSSDTNESVRACAVGALGRAFSDLTDEEKLEAWAVSYRLADDLHEEVRASAAYSLSWMFSDLTEDVKRQACAVLHRLASDHVSLVRASAAHALGRAYSHLTIEQKQEAWKDLLKLASDPNDWGRRTTAEALNQVYSEPSYRSKAWNLLQELAIDPDNDVASQALHSLGKACIQKATEAEEEATFAQKLQAAIDHFERSYRLEVRSNPSSFCYPFYRSFQAAVFEEAGELEVQRYLTEAKRAIEGSDSRGRLLEVVECLAQALDEARSCRSLEERQRALLACQLHCDRADDLLQETEDRAPGASKLLRRGRERVDRRIRELLEKIEEEAAQLEEAGRGTAFQPLVERVSDLTQRLSEADQIEVDSILNLLQPDIRSMCSFLSPRARESVSQLEDWEILSLEKKVPLTLRALSHCAGRMEGLFEENMKQEESNAFLRKEVLARLEEINFNTFRLSLRSAAAASSLYAMDWELKKLARLGEDMGRLGKGIDELGLSQQQALLVLEEEMPRLLEEMEKLAQAKGASGTIEDIADMKKRLATPMAERVIYIAGSLTSIVSAIAAFV